MIFIKIKCWWIRLRYGSQLYYHDFSGLYKDKLWSLIRMGHYYYRYVGKNLYFKLKKKYNF